jgi:hypothetical protein
MRVWAEIPTTINGLPTQILASQKWGVLILGDQPLALNEYLLQRLDGIQASRPIYEQHTISAKYKCTYASDNKLSFQPVEREHRFEDGRTTELVDITINLDEKIKTSVGPVSIGDVKDFRLGTQILAGFELPPDSSVTAPD